jgi:hypothetical protein
MRPFAVSGADSRAVSAGGSKMASMSVSERPSRRGRFLLSYMLYERCAVAGNRNDRHDYPAKPLVRCPLVRREGIEPPTR